jgi:hypothetical protein
MVSDYFNRTGFSISFSMLYGSFQTCPFLLAKYNTEGDNLSASPSAQKV